MIREVTKLCYLYINEYKGIKEKEFNLVSEYNIKFNKVNNVLIIEKNNHFIDGFFGRNIGDITAVVGENGSGKTRVLEFIKEKLFHNVEKSFEEFADFENFNTRISPSENHILIFKTSSNWNIYYNKKLMKSELSVEGVCAKDYKCYDYSQIKFANIKEINNIKMIYYANIYDYSRVDLEKERKKGNIYKFKRNYLDVSTNYFLDNTKSYRADEIERHLAYFKEGYTLGFKYPEKLKITLWGSVEKLIKDIEEKIEMDKIIDRKKQGYIYKSNNIYEYLKKILLKIFDKQQGKKFLESYDDVKVKFIGVLIFSFFLRYVNRKELLESPLDNEVTELGYQENNLEKSVISVLEKFKLMYKEKVKTNILEEIDALIGMVKLIESDKIKAHESPSEYTDEEYYQIVGLESLTKFIQLYQKLQFSNLTFDWDDIELSSGQKSILSIFSRLYSVKKQADYNDFQNLLIVMDEPEVYFHPKWQKKLISKLVEFCKNQFVNKNIQLVLTSNSPFIVSDLPKDNIIFLKNEDGVCEVADEAEFGRTFGANIHNLLATSFFMEDGTIGDFAKDKIDKIIEELNKYQEEFQEEYLGEKIDLNEISNTINYIGEPIIREKLLSMFSKMKKRSNDDNVNPLLESFDNLNSNDKKLFISKLINNLEKDDMYD